MMRLLLMRHGAAEDRAPSGRDADRRLTNTTVTRLAVAGRILADQGYAPGVILSSPFERARRTAELMAEALHPPCGVVVWDILAGSYTLAMLDDVVGVYSGVTELMIVGHNPTITHIVRHLADTQTVSLSPGMIAVVDLLSGSFIRREGNLQRVIDTETLSTSDFDSACHG